MTTCILTQEELKTQLHYNPETGIFIRLISGGNNKYKVGSVAGGFDALGYIAINISGKKYKAHRLAWFYIHGEWPKDKIDHINCIRSDNKIKNLRESTQQENCFNSCKRKNNKTGYKGVVLTKTGKYKACATLNYKNINLGYYENAKDAYMAYINFAKKNHKDFYRG